jgi:4-hydroxy-tetrahydrodipicolinate reductase
MHVLVDYTSHAAVRSHVDQAVARGVACVVGSSGLTQADHAEIDTAARARGVGVVAAGNFSVMAAILQYCALLAAQHLRSFEVIDYASDSKADVPSGTSRELAERLGRVQAPRHAIPPQAVADPQRGTWGQRGRRTDPLAVPAGLLRLDGGYLRPAGRTTALSAQGRLRRRPVRGGHAIAIRKVIPRVGVTRGLDSLLFPS